MPQKSHWPFGGDLWAHTTRGSGGANSKTPNQMMTRQRMRHDRLIVGGRAHTKKSGLS